MIQRVTSIADLIYKSKTQDPYKSLMILAVKGIFANNGQNRVIQSYEQALEALNEYTTGLDDCSMLVESINWYRSQITDPADEEFNRLFELKRRNASAAIQSMRYNGDYLTISGGGGYSQLSQEYGRIRREVMAGNSTYFIASQQRPAAETSEITSFDDGAGYEVIERHYINPATGMRHTVCRRIPSNIPVNIRREVEEELRLDAEAEMQRQMASSRRRNVSQFGDPEDFYSTYWDDDIPIRRRVNEDNPNNDR